MNYRNFSFTNSNYLICREIKRYSRTASGKDWKSKPDEIERAVVSAEHYTNYITSIPFFNNFGDGASCRARCTYECAGYLPTVVTTVSPFGETKVVASFRFYYLPDMRKTAGWRELQVLKNAAEWWEECKPQYWLLHLKTRDAEVTGSGCFDLKYHVWRG